MYCCLDSGKLIRKLILLLASFSLCVGGKALGRDDGHGNRGPTERSGGLCAYQQKNFCIIPHRDVHFCNCRVFFPNNKAPDYEPQNIVPMIACVILAPIVLVEIP